MNALRILTLAAMLAAGALAPATAAERVGTSTADAPNLVAKFTLTNNSTNSIGYLIKWGNGAWKSYKLQAGQSWDHWVAIDKNNKYPTPHIRFDNVAGDGKVTSKNFKLKGYKVGYNGFGAKVAYSTTPKKYEFKAVAGPRVVNLFSLN